MIPKQWLPFCSTVTAGLINWSYDENVAVPQPGPGEVLVKVSATAKNNPIAKSGKVFIPTEREDDISSFRISGIPHPQLSPHSGRRCGRPGGGDRRRRPRCTYRRTRLLDFNIYAAECRDLNLTPDYYGPNGKDDGGPSDDEQSDDIGIRFPAPADR